MGVRFYTVLPDSEPSVKVSFLIVRAQMTFLAVAIGFVVCGSSALFAGDPTHHRVLDADTRPDDVRLSEPKDLNGYFPFEVPESKEAWQQRQAELKQRV